MHKIIISIDSLIILSTYWCQTRWWWGPKSSTGQIWLRPSQGHK